MDAGSVAKLRIHVLATVSSQNKIAAQKTTENQTRIRIGCEMANLFPDGFRELPQEIASTRAFLR